ncbi:rCG20261 [Rattus norvegicus]|uniref:RCG20261 n=1 Tax=Rattus norvegicus TaxID=10116 RepID=A6JGD5_RAT|nr:rCG20261 [Rattus norvegicus]
MGTEAGQGRQGAHPRECLQGTSPGILLVTTSRPPPALAPA